MSYYRGKSCIKGGENVFNVNEIIKNPQVVMLAEKIREYGIDVDLLNEEEQNEILACLLIVTR